MANAVSKIERLGLSERVSSLMVDDGITVGREIGRILRKEGHHVSDAAVNRYLAKVGRVAKSRADKIIQDHVDKVVPDDLVALERVESVSLKWFNEEPSEMADRLAGVKAAIDWEVDGWAKMISGASGAFKPEERSKLIKNIIKTCLEYILKDERLQDKRLKAAGMAVKVIELKLAKSGLLKDDGRGKIVIVDRSDEYEREEKSGETKKKVKPLVLQFSKPDAKDNAYG
jgi:hypothetical protein